MEQQTVNQINSEGMQLSVIARDKSYSEIVSSLDEKQRSEYLKLTTKLDVDNLSTVNNYGGELNKIIANNGESLLSQVRDHSNNEIMKLTDQLLMEIKDVSIDPLYNSGKGRGFMNFLKSFPIVRQLVSNVEKSKIKLDTAANNVMKISKKIEEAKSVALRDNGTLQEIFETSLKYVNEIKDYIIAGKVKIDELKLQLEQIKDDPKVEPYEVSSLQNFISMLQKRVTDMYTTEYLLNQNLLQIKAAQANNLEIASKSDNIVNNVVPVWKSQLALSIIMENQKNSSGSITRVQDTTQEILKKNAAALKSNTIELATQSEKSIVEVDTIRDTTQKLIECLNEVKQIHVNGEKSREVMETQLREYSKTLYDAIRNTSW